MLRTFELTFHQADWWSQILNKKVAEIYIKADLRVDGKLYRDVGVRGRGGTAWGGTLVLNSKKVPFKISTNEFVSGQDLLGYDKLDLNNGYRDPTFLREALALRAMRELVPAPQVNFVKLVINGDNWGVYINVQPIDNEFIEENYRNAKGNRYKGEQELKYYGSDPAKWKWPIQLLTPNGPPAYQDVIRAMRTTTITPIATRAQEMPKLIDIDMAHRHLAINAMIGNSDSAPVHNFYLYLDPFHDLMRMLPWDMNMAFLDRNSSLHLLPRIFNDTAKWERRYQGHLRTVVERILDWHVVGAWATAWHQLIDAEVQADTKKLYSYANFVSNLATSSVNISPSVRIHSIKSTIDTRRARYLNEPALTGARVELKSARHSPRTPDATQGVQFTVKATSTVAIHQVVLHHRARGHFAETDMFDDGQHGDGAPGDGIYGVALPPQPAGGLVSYYFSAVADPQAGGDINFLPWNSARSAPNFRVQPLRTSVLIHEFLALNKNGIRAPSGDREDWVELFNPTSNAVDLSGHYLTDDSAEPTKWQFANGTVLPANGHLLLWADDDPTYGSTHLGFKLSKDGEEIALLDSAGAALDLVRFGPQKKDISTGRLFDRLSPLVTHLEPTPAKQNEVSPCGSRRWSTLNPDDSVMELSASGTMKIGTTLTLTLDRAPASSQYLLQLSPTPGIFEIPALSISLLISPPIVNAVLLPTNNQGQGTLPIPVPNDPNFAGLRLSTQAVAHDGRVFLASNGVEIEVCR